MLFGFDVGIDTRIILNLIFLLFPLSLTIVSIQEGSYFIGVMAAILYFVLGFTMYFILATPELAC